jgi:rhodanese-related sulfurtransferase
MRKVLSLLLLFLVALGIALPAAADDLPRVPPDDLLAALKTDQKILVLDVRSEQEYASGHVPGARNIPHDELESRIEEVRVEGAERIVVYCESGYRAGEAGTVLRESGFENVEHLSGDMKAWRNQKLPLKRPLGSVQKQGHDAKDVPGGK